MNEKIEDQLKRLLDEGKISDEEKRKLEEAIEKDSVDEISVFPTDGKRIELNLSGFVSTDIKITGEKGLDEVKIIEGKEFIEIEKKENTFMVRPKYKDKRTVYILGIHIGNALLSSRPISIVIPSESDVTLHTVSGDLHIEHLSGNITAKTVDGDIRINDVAGDIKLESISGDVKGNNLSGAITVSLKSGDIIVDKGKLNGALKTYSGDVVLKDVLLERIELVSFSGDVRIIDASLNGNLFLKTISGDCVLKAKNLDAKIVAKTKSGDIIFKDKEGNLKNIRNSEFLSGEGKYDIVLKTISGDVRIEEIKLNKGGK
ncbi:MAG: DUF4097 family beta strand repeat protein [Caldisericaceae bacterium]|nr:DUF4097 family beta strand repeat protein [Caldisericaceae bacterium]